MGLSRSKPRLVAGTGSRAAFLVADGRAEGLWNRQGRSPGGGEWRWWVLFMLPPAYRWGPGQVGGGGTLSARTGQGRREKAMWTEEGEGGRKGQRPGTVLELMTIMTQKHTHSTGESPTAWVQILGFPSLGLSLPTCELGVMGMPVSQVRGEGGMRLDTEQAPGTHVSPGMWLLSFRELAGPGLRLDQPGVLSPLCVPSCV